MSKAFSLGYAKARIIRYELRDFRVGLSKQIDIVSVCILVGQHYRTAPTGTKLIPTLGGNFGGVARVVISDSNKQMLRCFIANSPLVRLGIGAWSRQRD